MCRWFGQQSHRLEPPYVVCNEIVRQRGDVWVKEKAFEEKQRVFVQVNTGTSRSQSDIIDDDDDDGSIFWKLELLLESSKF